MGRGGIVHRREVRDAQWTDAAVRAAAASGSVTIVRRTWVATASVHPDLLAAARAGARITCVTAARHRGWWMPETADTRRHLAIAPHAKPGRFEPGDRVHWTIPVAPTSAFSLWASIEDALSHIATCEPYEVARTLWESAVRVEKLASSALQAVKWTTLAAARLAREVSDLSDSGLESIFLIRLSPWGLPVRQQVILAGHPVDFLIGDRLVVQVDGHAHHSRAADRGRDVAHDRELTLRGYTVLRFTYAQVLHGWPAVERSVVRAIAAGHHLRRSSVGR